LESFNFLNTTTSADNMATFAASASSTTSSFNMASKLSFNQHLEQSFVAKLETVKTDVLSENTVDIKALSNEIISFLKSGLSNQKIDNDNIHKKQQSIEQLLNQLNLSDKDKAALKSELEAKELESSVDASLPEIINDDQQESVEQATTFNDFKALNNKAKIKSEFETKELADSQKTSSVASIDDETKDSGEESLVNADTSIVNDDELTQLNELKQMINDVTPLSLRNELSNSLDKVVELLQIEESSKADDYFEVKNVDEIIESLNVDDVMEKINAKHSEISSQLENDELSPADEKQLIELQRELETVLHVLNNTPLDNAQLPKLLESTAALLVNDNELKQVLISFTERLNEIQPALRNNQSTVSSSSSLNDDDELTALIQEKMVGILEKLPPQYQGILKQEFGSANPKIPDSKEPVTHSPEKLLTSIEDSHNALNQQGTSDKVKVADNEKVNTDKSVERVINEKNRSEQGSKVSEELTKGQTVKQDITLENKALENQGNDEPTPNDRKIESLIAQLESTFRSSQQASNQAAEMAQVNAKTEQQAIKDVNPLNQNTSKAADVNAPRILLHENVAAAQQLKDHLIMMSRGGLGQAVLQLDPEELGAMSVRIVMQNDQMNVSFQVQNPQAKELLEQAMAKLKESLEEQGIELQHSDVEQNGTGNNHSLESGEQGGSESSDEFDETDVEPITLTLNKQSTNGIDYYA